MFLKWDGAINFNEGIKFNVLPFICHQICNPMYIISKGTPCFQNPYDFEF